MADSCGAIYALTMTNCIDRFGGLVTSRATKVTEPLDRVYDWGTGDQWCQYFMREMGDATDHTESLALPGRGDVIVCSLPVYRRAFADAMRGAARR